MKIIGYEIALGVLLDDGWVELRLKDADNIFKQVGNEFTVRHQQYDFRIKDCKLNKTDGKTSLNKMMEEILNKINPPKIYLKQYTGEIFFDEECSFEWGVGNSCYVSINEDNEKPIYIEEIENITPKKLYEKTINEIFEMAKKMMKKYMVLEKEDECNDRG